MKPWMLGVGAMVILLVSSFLYLQSLMGASLYCFSRHSNPYCDWNNTRAGIAVGGFVLGLLLGVAAVWLRVKRSVTAR